MSKYRSNTCGELRKADVGRQVRLSGWIHSVRDHGGVIFIDLRDHYGITQIVIDPECAFYQALERWRVETVVRFDGVVVAGKNGKGLSKEDVQKNTDGAVGVLKALDADGEGSTADILQAMQWVWSNAETYGIRIVCMSFGATPAAKRDPLAAGVKALHSRGLTVVASAGNGGPEHGTVMSPGISPYAITVGGARIAGDKAEVSDFSSRGPCNGIAKPDLLAPAEDIVCPEKRDYAPFSGTSIAAPIVAGACARIVSAHPGFTPDRVKEELKKHAGAMPGSIDDVGAGLLCMSRAEDELV